MNIGIILDRPPNPVMAQAIELLQARNVSVESLYPDQMLVNMAELRVAHDWYVLKGGSPATLTFAGMLHMLGAKIMHPYPTAVMLRNKLFVMQALQTRGVPSPETYMVTQMADVLPLLASGPFILKPNDGRRGEGIRIIRQAAELESLTMSRPFLVQRYYQPDGDGRDLKIYRIGDGIFGIWRMWPIRNYMDKIGEFCPVTPEVQQIVASVGDIFGVTLYGVDIVISGGHPYVVDVNNMGGCMGVPNAPELLTEYFLREGPRL